jgi:hypothetical protein
MGMKIGLILSAMFLVSYPVEILKLLAWTWLASVAVLLAIWIAAIVVRSLILPITDPNLYRQLVKFTEPL